MMFVQRWLGLSLVIVSCCVLDRSIATEAVPRGHLQPLGAHTEPGGVEERTDIPTPLDFWNNYVKVSKAVVFRGAAKHSKAFKLWTDDYLKEEYGKLEVRIENKDESIHGIPVGDVCLGRDTIGNFIEQYHKSNRYLVSELPVPMYGDISVPPCFTCGTFANRFVEIDIWMSAGGSKSILHKDAFNAINCVVNGSKQWKLIEYKHERNIYKAFEPGNEIGGFSLINTSSVDLIKYPNLIDVPWSYVEINAGDCLFLPKSCYHQVNSFGSNNIAVALLFSRLDKLVDYNNIGCETHSSEYVPLSEIDVDWQYPGYGEMTMGNTDLELVRESLLELVNEHGAITIKILKSFIKGFAFHRWREPDVEKMFMIMGKRSDSVVTKDDILSLNKTGIRMLGWALERYEPSNTYTHEYSYILVEDLSEAIENLLENGNGIARSELIMAYTKGLGGSEKFANRIFAGFKAKDQDKATYDEVTEHLDDVLKPYVTYSIKDRGPLREDKFEEEEDSGDNEEEEDDGDDDDGDYEDLKEYGRIHKEREENEAREGLGNEEDENTSEDGADDNEREEIARSGHEEL